ncbi:peroxisomal membrane protein 13-like isoform X2 [Mangifera indica]|uniref:peroxisomal membrane protein 13-like isoform X2 n=1 Tax=Mangifera indica TaxID=29780 RepID=UPI001CFAF96F|nr:peroxisomal membrane protein 13-like isoform X2 [Mangifera indica]
MESNAQSPPAHSPPPKPWERAGVASGRTPFKPPSAGNTSDIVESSGTANPGEIVSTSNRTATVKRNTLGYGSTLNYNSGLGSGMYGSYGGLGGLYSNGMYGGGYGGLDGSGMYGGGMYNGSFGGPMGGYGMGMGCPYGVQDPNNPHGGPSSPPGFWISLLRVMQGVVNFFGRISILIDQNTQAFHMFMTALLQIFDRTGLLYGELARFVLQILGIKQRPRKVQPQGPNGLYLPGHNDMHANQNFIEGPKAAPGESWDNVWGNNPSK